MDKTRASVPPLALEVRTEWVRLSSPRNKKLSCVGSWASIRSRAMEAPRTSRPPAKSGGYRRLSDLAGAYASLSSVVNPVLFIPPNAELRGFEQASHGLNACRWNNRKPHRHTIASPG